MSDRVIKNNYLNILYGLLLGKSFMVQNNKEIKLILKIEGKHISYMKDIHKKISNLGYCDKNFPKLITQLGKKGKLTKLMILNTLNYNYLWEELYHKWYLNKLSKNIPMDLKEFFNEESLCYWLMTEGQIRDKKLYVNMKEFSDIEIQYFITFLENQFKLDKINLIINNLEFNSNNIKQIYSLTKPYISSSMKFKFMTPP